MEIIKIILVTIIFLAIIIVLLIAGLKSNKKSTSQIGSCCQSDLDYYGDHKGCGCSHD